MALGENIKKFRKEKGLTQKEVAKKIEKSCSTFQKYELNLTKPPIEVIKEIANVLDISMVDLHTISLIKSDEKKQANIYLTYQKFPNTQSLTMKIKPNLDTSPQFCGVLNKTQF